MGHESWVGQGPRSACRSDGPEGFLGWVSELQQGFGHDHAGAVESSGASHEDSLPVLQCVGDQDAELAHSGGRDLVRNGVGESGHNMVHARRRAVPLLRRQADHEVELVTHHARRRRVRDDLVAAHEESGDDLVPGVRAERHARRTAGPVAGGAAGEGIGLGVADMTQHGAIVPDTNWSFGRSQ
jgi:hypothetical protein